MTYNNPPSLAVIASLSSLLDQAMERWLQEQIEESPKTYLLRGRSEPCPHRPAIYKTVTFRHYLRVVVPNHRFAITRMLLSDHPFALERGRWAERDPSGHPKESTTLSFLQRGARAKASIPEWKLVVAFRAEHSLA